MSDNPEKESPSGQARAHMVSSSQTTYVTVITINQLAVNVNQASQPGGKKDWIVRVEREVLWNTNLPQARVSPMRFCAAIKERTLRSHSRASRHCKPR
jgi:hypothetical protein